MSRVDVGERSPNPLDDRCDGLWLGRPGIVLGVGMALAVAGYVAVALFPLSDVLEPWKHASPWDWALGGDPLVNLIIAQTHTCYLSERGERHDWGHGCGRCPACELRRRGYEKWSQR